MKLAEQLKNTRTQITELHQKASKIDCTLGRAILRWKIEKLQEQADWMEQVLYGK